VSIVVCYPGPADGAMLVDAAAVHAARAGTELVILHHGKFHELDQARDVDREVDTVARHRSELEALAADVASRHDIRCRVELLTSASDSPSTELLEAIHDEAPELVVIGVRTRSRVGKFLLGSTTQDLLLGATASVLSVHVDRPRPSRGAS
jgi:nucleotide-binding universal stress UspA family protein